MSFLTLDIETCQTQNPEIISDISDNLRPPGNIKKQESIEKWYIEKHAQSLDDAVSKTSFDGFAGGVISIAFAVDDGPIKYLYRTPDDSEKTLLFDFWKVLTDSYDVNFNPVWVGHNICEFDLPFIFKRCVVNNVKPSIILPHNAKPWGHDVFDTLYESMGLKFSGGSLDRICKVLGIGEKTDGIGGADINQAWFDGRHDEIIEYNKNDVHLTRELFKRLNFAKTVKEII